MNYAAGIRDSLARIDRIKKNARKRYAGRPKGQMFSPSKRFDSEDSMPEQSSPILPKRKVKKRAGPRLRVSQVNAAPYRTIGLSERDL